MMNPDQARAYLAEHLPDPSVGTRRLAPDVRLKCKEALTVLDGCKRQEAEEAEQARAKAQSAAIIAAKAAALKAAKPASKPKPKPKRKPRKRATKKAG